ASSPTLPPPTTSTGTSGYDVFVTATLYPEGRIPDNAERSRPHDRTRSVDGVGQASPRTAPARAGGGPVRGRRAGRRRRGGPGRGVDARGRRRPRFRDGHPLPLHHQPRRTGGPDGRRGAGRGPAPRAHAGLARRPGRGRARAARDPAAAPVAGGRT